MVIHFQGMDQISLPNSPCCQISSWTCLFLGIHGIWGPDIWVRLPERWGAAGGVGAAEPPSGAAQGLLLSRSQFAGLSFNADCASHLPPSTIGFPGGLLSIWNHDSRVGTVLQMFRGPFSLGCFPLPTTKCLRATTGLEVLRLWLVFRSLAILR